MKKLFKTMKSIFILVMASLQVAMSISLSFSFFQYMFFLIYMGAILVLMLYLFFSSLKISFYFFKQNSMFLVLMVLMVKFYWLLKNTGLQSFSKEYSFSLYKYKEMVLMVWLCIYIMLVLFAMMNLDSFRFSSLRSLY